MKKYAFYGLNTLLCFSILFLNGCRFGNHSEQAKPFENKSQYKSIEFFFTTPKSFETKVILNSIGGPDMVVYSNTKAPLASIPSSILNVLTDPVYFAVPNAATSYPIFRDYRDSTSLLTQLDNNGNIALDYVPSDGPFVLWNNQNCITNFEITQEGSFDRSKPGSIKYEDGTIAPVAGNLSLTYTFSRVIGSINGTDHCTNDLTRLATCYADGTGCSTDELSSARALFDLYVKQTGVLKIEDAAKIKAMEYIVHYE